MIGLTTVGMMFVAVGVFFSALTRNQIVAAIGTFVALFMLVLLALVAFEFAQDRGSSWADGLRYAAVLFQVTSFGLGQLDVRYLAMHLSVTAFMLFVSVKVLQLR